MTNPTRLPHRSGWLLLALLFALAAGCGASRPVGTDSATGSSAFVPSDSAPVRTRATPAAPGGDAVASLERETADEPRLLAPPPQRELLLEFHPHHALHPFDYVSELRDDRRGVPVADPDGDTGDSGDTGDGNGDGDGETDTADADADADADGDPDPPVVSIDDETIRACGFVDRAFRMHHQWYLMFLRELMVARVARLEAAREGITFTDAEIDAASQNVVGLAQQRARRLRRSWREHWQSLGYETEAAYLTAVRAQVARVLLLERLVLLMDMRLTKVAFSWIVIRDRADRLTPDPRAKAQKIAEQIRDGSMEFATAVRRFTTDANSRAKQGRYGVIVRGTLGVEDLENWLFSNPPGSVSDPILHPVYGWVIARVDATQAGQPDVTWSSAAERLQQRLDDQQGLPGTRVTGRDTFIWLERVMATGRYEVRSFAPLPESGQPWVATIDGEPITAGDMVRHAFRHNPDWARLILSEVIVFALARREAEREGIDVTDGEVRHAAGSLATYLRESARQSGQNFDQVWRGQGYESLQAFIDTVIRPLARESLIMERLVMLHDLRVESRELWHVLCQSEELAKRARAALLQGAKFEDVAKALSQHAPSRQRGGLLGRVPRGTYGEAFDKVAFSLSLNGISEPVQTEQGWHIIRVTKIWHGRPSLTWDGASQQIERLLAERGSIPGQRITSSDTSRWVEDVHKTERYRVTTHVE